MSTFKEKYIKYKKKYIELKNKMKGGSRAHIDKAIEDSKKTALTDKIIRELQADEYDNNKGEKISWSELSDQDRYIITQLKFKNLQIDEDRKNITENIVGPGINFCTGFKITPKVIFTASHCCGDLKQFKLDDPTCKLKQDKFKFDETLIDYINQYMNDYKLPQGVTYNTSGGHIDFMILTNKDIKEEENKMIVPFLPHDAKKDDYTFEWVSKLRDTRKSIDIIKFIPFTFKHEDAFEDYTYQSLAKDIKSSDIIYSGNSGSPVFAIKKNTGKYFFMGVLSGSAVGESKDGAIIDIHKRNEVKLDSEDIIKTNKDGTNNKFGINNKLTTEAINKRREEILSDIKKTNVYKALLEERFRFHLAS